MEIELNNLYNEPDVREKVVSPILRFLGYSDYMIEREKHFSTNFGSGKPITGIIDYVCYILKPKKKVYFIIETKGPIKDIKKKRYIDQANGYASPIEIKAKYFCLCNGKYFDIYSHQDGKLLKSYSIKDIVENKEIANDFKDFLSSEKYEQYLLSLQNENETDQEILDYQSITPPTAIKVKKQSMKRHFGVHGYFTRQSWDILQTYIETFTKKGDLVLDPFCGTGVTYTEAILLNRRAITTDINPLSIFMTKAKLLPVNLQKFGESAEKIIDKFETMKPKDDKDEKTIEYLLDKYKDLLPKNENLYQDKKVIYNLYDLFTPHQMSELVLLKSLILDEKDYNTRESLMLAFSSTLSKCNLTYHKMETGGNANPISAKLNYKIATKPFFCNIKEEFNSKIANLITAKAEIQNILTPDTLQKILDTKMFNHDTILKHDATDLSFIPDNSIDYIYSDPPYAAHIKYLDLSVMWNAWLGFDVSMEDYKAEMIEKGSLQKTPDEYYQLFTKNIIEVYRVLKPGRWFSIVFQHKNPNYWYLITDVCKELGFEYKGYVNQRNGQDTFRKKMNPASVFGGQMIINFFKPLNKKTSLENVSFLKATLPKPKPKSELEKLKDRIVEVIERCILQNLGASSDNITNYLQMDAIENKYIKELQGQNLFGFIVDILEKNYIEKNGKYYVKDKFTIKTSAARRIKYFLYLYLLDNIKNTLSLDEIITNVLPKTNNGEVTSGDLFKRYLNEFAELDVFNNYKLKEELLNEKQLKFLMDTLIIED